MSVENTKIILASQSPRRQELMRKLGYEFITEVSGAEEIIPDDMPASGIAEYLSGLKAEEVYEKHSCEPVIVIGSDTIVLAEDGEVFGKPADRADAYRMLRQLSGRVHEVRTGVTILSGIPGGQDPERISFTSVTKVKFYELDDEEIWEYIDSGEPMDKAGAYGIQGKAVFFVEKIDGDYNTVIGFPLAAVGRILRRLRRETAR